MIIPQRINVGDKIGIISTARKISFKELKPAIEILEIWGLKVILGNFLFESENQFSASVAKRAADLQKMINDDTIRAVLCARGGYGTVQIIDQIDFSILYNKPKWIIGYSDITILHSHLNQIGLATLHATMPINFSQNTEDALNSLHNDLFNNSEKIINAPAHKFNRLGKVKAEIVGGNLSVLYSLIGSRSIVNTDHRILFLEDLDEYLYHIDRMIINMKRSGMFNNLKGMIIGAMNDMHDNIIPFGKTAEEIILEHVEEYNFIFCFGFPSGHIDGNRSLRLGVSSVLEINENSVNLSQP